MVGFADPAQFTTAVYQANVAGKPRLPGARAALEALGVPDADQQAAAYAARKQTRLGELIHSGNVAAFLDALRFVQALRLLGWPVAVASSSKNANAELRKVQLADGSSLHDAFSVNVCGQDLRAGKPDPEIFLLAATQLKMHPASCFVAEDARAGGMAGLGGARLGDAALLRAKDVTLVVASLDEVATAALAHGHLARRPA